MITNLAIALALAATPVAHDDNDDRPNRTGCCVSFDHSPVVLCLTDGACRFGPKP